MPRTMLAASLLCMCVAGAAGLPHRVAGAAGLPHRGPWAAPAHRRASFEPMLSPQTLDLASLLPPASKPLARRPLSFARSGRRVLQAAGAAEYADRVDVTLDSQPEGPPPEPEIVLVDAVTAPADDILSAPADDILSAPADDNATSPEETIALPETTPPALVQAEPPEFLSVGQPYYADDVDVYLDSCPPGYFCPSDSSPPWPCPAGTYRDAQGGTAPADCLPCPAGSFCPAASAAAEACPAGTFRRAAGGRDLSDCSPCPAGSFCVAGAAEPAQCAPGRHRVAPGGRGPADCAPCAPGTFSPQGGSAEACAPCEAGYFCRTPTSREACPKHTASAEGSYSRANCKCDPGYTCAYHRHVDAIVDLNATIGQFRADVEGIQSAFKAALAAASSVNLSSVFITGVLSREPQRPSRRPLSSEGSLSEEFGKMPQLHEEQRMRRKMDLGIFGDPYASEPRSISVYAKLTDARRLDHLEQKLEDHAPGLHLAHRWERRGSIEVKPEAPEI